ncbi:MAG: hypothetical protein U0324_06765 [Polyangiales bacterium]
MRTPRTLFAASLAAALGCTPQRRAPAVRAALDARPAEAHAAPAPTSDARDLLHCDLDLRAYELGAPDDGPPSAPVRTADGFLVAFTRGLPLDAGRSRNDLLVQRTDAAGELLPAARVAEDVHLTTPRVAGDRDTIYLQAQPPAGGRFVLTMLQTDGALPLVDRPAPLLAGWAEDLAVGPRGAVATWGTRTAREVERGIDRQHAPVVSLPASTMTPIPTEQLVASGASVDLALIQSPGSLRVAVLDPVSATARERVLAPVPADRWLESSLAAGPAGFAAVFVDVDLRTLRLQRFDARGEAIGEPTLWPAPDAHVRRYPRVAALGEGWAVSYWDGVGPAVQRFDAEGRVMGAPVQVRSGDERGGHTEARMVARDDALAVSWHVHEPEFSHGLAQEVPRRPGPRLAVLRCRGAR